jgi:hypothetical protein
MSNKPPSALARLLRHLRAFDSDTPAFTTLVAIATLSPLIALSAFIHPQDWDFDVIESVRENGYWGSIVTNFSFTGGRYFAWVLVSLMPLPADPTLTPLTAESLTLYRAAPVLALASLALSLHFLVGTVFTGPSRRQRWLLVLTMLSMYFTTIQNHAEILYWYSGIAQYFSSLILLCLFLGWSIRLAERPGRLSFAMASFTACAAVGCNETMLLDINIILVAICLGMFWTRHPSRKAFFGVFCLSVAFSLAAFLAPGNAARDTMTEFSREKSLGIAVASALERSFANALYWITATTLFSLLLLDHIKRKGFSLNPVLRDVRTEWLAGTVLACYVMGYFPNAWARGGINPAYRIVATAQFILILGILLTLSSLAFRNSPAGAGWMAVGRPVRRLLILATACTIHMNGRVKLTYTDLFRHAAAFDRQMLHRYESIRTSTSDTIVVPPLAYKPLSIQFRDMQASTEWWVNRDFAKYFKSKPIRMGWEPGTVDPEGSSQ